jgi:SAM-dependent methyltransferase
LPLSQKLDFKKLKIIDIGIGPGWFEQELEQRLGIGLDVVGIDLENIDNKLVKMVIADANNIPFKPTSFDFIFCLDSVHLIKRPGAMLRLLRPEGHLLISSFCSRYTAMEKRKEILRFFSKAKLLKESVVGDPKLEMSYVALFKVNKGR